MSHTNDAASEEVILHANTFKIFPHVFFEPLWSQRPRAKRRNCSIFMELSAMPNNCCDFKDAKNWKETDNVRRRIADLVFFICDKLTILRECLIREKSAVRL